MMLGVLKNKYLSKQAMKIYNMCQYKCEKILIFICQKNSIAFNKQSEITVFPIYNMFSCV